MIAAGCGELAEKRFNKVSVGAILVCLAALAATPVFASRHSTRGVEIGNGSFLDSQTFATLGLQSLEGLDVYEGQSSLEFLAPPSDWFPQTRVRIEMYPAGFSSEQLIKSLLPSSQGWIGLTVGKALRFHRERMVAVHRHLFELQAYQDDKKIVVTLEGNKHKSAVYTALLSDLMDECDRAEADEAE